MLYENNVGQILRVLLETFFDAKSNRQIYTLKRLYFTFHHVEVSIITDNFHSKILLYNQMFNLKILFSNWNWSQLSNFMSIHCRMRIITSLFCHHFISVTDEIGRP